MFGAPCICYQTSHAFISAFIPVIEYWPVNNTFAVPLITIFTKFDGQIVAEYVKLTDIENIEDRWEKARENAEISFQTVYLPKVLNTEHPPKAHVLLQGEIGKHFLAHHWSWDDRYGHSREQLSSTNWEDSWCNWWHCSQRIVYLNTKEQPWPFC